MKQILPFIGIYLIGDGLISIYVFKDQELKYQLGRIARAILGGLLLFKF